MKKPDRDIKKDCPLDGNCEFQFLYNSIHSEYNLPIYRCNTCKIQRLYPIPANTDEYYQEDYYTGRSEYSYIDERSVYKYHSYVWDSRLSLIEKYYKKYGSNNKKLRLLEVGSSFGGFLSRAKIQGWEVQGIEISEYSSSYANQNEIPTYTGSIEDSGFVAGSFDAIVLSEVIEHLPNPKSSFDRLAELLSNGGILVLQTANFSGWQARSEGASYHYYLPGHLFYYSESNLISILKMRGFTKFISFYGSDVSLISKLRKMRGSFQSLLDYRKWIPTTLYHIRSKVKWKGHPLTSGYVLYSFKGGSDLDRVV